MQFQFLGTPQKHGLDWACVLCLPRSEQLRQPGACRAHSPWVWCTFSPPWSQPQFPCAPVRCVCLMSILRSWPLATPSWRMSTIQNLRKSLVRNWEPVCSLVGGAISGAEFAPFPSPLPPASGRGWACPQLASSSLGLLSPFILRTAGSVFRLVNFLSLSCDPTV